MTYLNKPVVLKLTILFFIFLLVNASLGLFAREQQLETLFQWAKMDYIEKRYRDVIKNLELLLSFYDEEPGENEQQTKRTLKGKIHLLMGAAHEQMGHIERARENYQLARDILENQDVRIEFEGIDLTKLKEYQRVMMKKKKPKFEEHKMIEKPGTKPKKKRISPLLIVAGTAVIGGVITAVLLLNKKEGEEEITVDVNYDTRTLGIEWVQVPAGEFMMGDNFNEGNSDELPVHAVYLGQYYISRYEVTFAQYDNFCEETGRQRPPSNGWGRGNRPAINVTWGDARAFCEWLSRKTTKNIHLPTEAQWEKAARGTDQRRCPWGNSPPDCNKANYDCDTQTHQVGSHPAGISPYGIYDMVGNVSEWCWDQYSEFFYSQSPYTNPFNPPPSGNDSEEIVYFVIRGGSWDTNRHPTFRCSDRYRGVYIWTIVGYYPSISDERNTALGFRIVRE